MSALSLHIGSTDSMIYLKQVMKCDRQNLGQLLDVTDYTLSRSMMMVTTGMILCYSVTVISFPAMTLGD